MLSPAIAEIANGSFRQKEPPAIIGSGFVVGSIEAALWVFQRSDSFREGALRAVNLGTAISIPPSAVWRPGI
jgi:ADP-ribosylglycohydrolase